MTLERLSPEDAARRAIDRHSDPDWLARNPGPREWQIERITTQRVEQAELSSDLQSLGFAVEDPWELYLYGNYEDALPVLLKHLRRDYSDGVRCEIARALAQRWSAPYWSEFVDLYHMTTARTQDQLAVILSTIVTRKTLPQYMDLILDESNGDSRILLVSALKRLRDPAGRSLLNDLQTHPVLGWTATRSVSGRSMNS